MTTANKVTIIRILLVPFFAVHLLYYTHRGDEIHRLLALLAFAVAAISDGVDGYIARRYNQRSELGAILDPLADKLLLVMGLALLTLDHLPHFDPIPLYLVVTVFSRDLIILLGMVVIYYICGKVDVRAHLVGKVATVLQMVTVAWVLLKWPATTLEPIAAAAALGTGISGILYVLDGVRQLSASPKSSPTTDGTSPK
jgi:CDP-diacylglycerol--glycerol-3-phosphate 3-phosphatidyltransferase